MGCNHALLGKVQPVTDLHTWSGIDALPRSASRVAGRWRSRNSKYHRAHKLHELRAENRLCLCTEIRSWILEGDLRKRRQKQFSRKLRRLLHRVSGLAGRHYVRSASLWV